MMMGPPLPHTKALWPEGHPGDLFRLLYSPRPTSPPPLPFWSPVLVIENIFTAGPEAGLGEGGSAAYEDAVEVMAAGFGSSSAPPTHLRSQFFFAPLFFFLLFSLVSLFTTPSCMSNSSLRAFLFLIILLFIFTLLPFMLCLFFIILD